ncbi:MAG: YqgE/AlgH family protein [Xanthomonadaceae bacterium]|jgi:putative transcriptional regulator|nr:YqgE/AlgH family protein [Xanthomonadaceae bacterium]
MSEETTYLANHLLIALPVLDDPNFARSVVLICRHDAEGAMGIVINRSADYSLGALMEQLNIEIQDAALSDRTVFSGGPVHPERGFVLHDGQRIWDSTLKVADDLHVTTSRDLLEAMAAGKGPGRTLFALGCAGWEQGQLERELNENAWLTVPADPALIFEMPLEQRWWMASDSIGVDPFKITDYSGHV